MPPPTPVPTAQLLAESVWLERLARRLVREPADAADAAQETDTEGRFVFEELCAENTSLSVHAADAPHVSSFDLAAQPDLAALELRIPGPRYLRVLLDDPERADGLALHDAHDQALDIIVQVGGVQLWCAAFHIQGGASDVILTDERARTLVLRRGGKESERIPLFLSAGSVNEVRP